MSKKTVVQFVLVLLSTYPVITLAQVVLPSIPGEYGGTIGGIVDVAADVILTAVWTIAVTFVVIMFVLAGFKYLTAQGDPTKVSEAHRAVIWGLAGTAVIVLSWSVISAVRLQFGGLT